MTTKTQAEEGTEEQTVGPVAVRVDTKRVHVKLADIEPNPWQPRAALSQEHIREIAESIAQVGLLQRPLARAVVASTASGVVKETRKHQLAFGHARIEAIRLLAQEGRWPWPTVELDVRPLTDKDMAVFALAENAKRRDVPPLDTYRAWRKAIQTAGMTQEELAEKVGIARPTLSNALRVLALPAVVLERVDSGELSVHGAREFLCLLAEDHAHVGIMEEVVREIAGTRLGSGMPDWRGANVRRLIRAAVERKLVAEWRRLDGGIAEFDVKEFSKAFATRVHAIPNDEPAGGGKSIEKSVAWTCETREWKRWQDRVKTHAQGTMPGVRESKVDEEIRKALEKDPVARALARGGVSEETAVNAVLGEVKVPEDVAEILKAPVSAEASAEEGDCGAAECPVHHGGSAPYCLLAEEELRAAAYRKLNAWCAAYVHSHSEHRDWANMSDDSYRLRESLGIQALTEEQVFSVVHKFAEDMQLKFDKAMKAKAPAGPLTPEQKKALGSRGEPILNLSTSKAWRQSLSTTDYGGLPSYFPDVKECLERCTIGARYARQSPQYGNVHLVCTNAEHFGEKLEKGAAAFKLELARKVEELAARDRPIAEELEERMDAGTAYAITVALLGSGLRFGHVQPAGQRDFSFAPPPLTWVRDALGLPEETRTAYDVFSAGGVLKALGDHPEKATFVAGSLLVYALGYSVERGKENPLEAVAKVLGIAPTEHEKTVAEEKPKGRRKAKVRKGMP